MKTVLEKPVSKETVFDLTEAELRERIRSTAESDIQNAFDKGTYISYFDEELCPNEDMLIHEYIDHKELVRIDEHGKTTLIRIL